MGLLEITKLPTAENAVIHLHPSDNIGIARVALSPGQELRVDGRAITVADPVPAGHKVALGAIGAGEHIVRYGQVMGRARIRIEPGQHVHTHNVAFEELAFDYEFPAGDIAAERASKDAAAFLGYPREDGRVGTRNYIAVVAASNCAAHTAELIAASFDGESAARPTWTAWRLSRMAKAAGTPSVRTREQLQRTLGGVLDHPNVAAAIILGLGCEVNQIDHYLGDRELRRDRSAGGHDAAIERRDARDGGSGAARDRRA